MGEELVEEVDRDAAAVFGGRTNVVDGEDFSEQCCARAADGCGTERLAA
jgi:hypothetical protein